MMYFELIFHSEILGESIVLRKGNRIPSLNEAQVYYHEMERNQGKLVDVIEVSYDYVKTNFKRRDIEKLPMFG